MEASEKEEIRARTDIVELIGGYTALRQAGRSYKGLCPFHQEKTPSFTVNPEKGLWRCYGACQTGGDVFSFLMKAEGLSFPEASERLANRAGVTITPLGGDREEAERTRSERERIYAANAAAVRFFREAFSRATLAQEYARKRGLAHETLEDFGIGYAPDDWSQLADYLKRNGVHLADAEKAGLVGASRRGDGTYIDKFRGRLIFPIHDLQERVVAFGGRLLLPAENAPKYLNSPETPVFSKSKILYGLARARKAIQERDLAVVVEGYMDAVACHQAGIANVVAILGTALTDEHVRLIRRHTKNVVLSLDSDEAGIRAALRSAELFAGAGDDMTLRILSLPPGEDPDAMLARGGSALFLKAIEGAVTVPEFRLRTAEARFDTRTDEGKAAFLREAVPIIAEVGSPLEQDRLVRRFAHYHVDGGAHAEESLRAEIQHFRAGRRGNTGGGGDTSGGYIPDAPPASGPPVPLRGQPVTRVRGGAFNGRGGMGADGRKGYPPGQRPPGQQAYQRGGSGGGGNGYGGYSGGYRQYAAPAPALPEFAPSPASQRTAAEKAEQTLIQAFLSDEWSASLRDRLRPEHFTDPLTARLVEAILPLVGGGYSPTDAVAQLTDDLLRDHAESLSLSDEDAEATPAALADCLRALETRRKQSEINEIRAALSSDTEGNPNSDGELFSRWAQKARALKARDEGQE